MKNILKKALNDVFTKTLDTTPKTKKKTLYVIIDDVKPSDISSFMSKNKIPEDAYFSGKPNGYDSFDEVCLAYEIDIPTTEKDKIDYQRRKFNANSFRPIYELLSKNGYKRISLPSNLLAEFKDTTAYDMYVIKDFDRLEKYYSLSFEKIQQS